MNNHLLRIALRAAKVPVRNAGSASVSSHNIVLDQKLRDEIHPKIGNREIVGHGINGMASYIDRCEFPFPAIRFKESTPEVLQLREKEKGDWNKLSLADKKALYRASFCQTFSEVNAPTGEWKPITTMIIFAITLTGWLILYVRKFVYSPQRPTVTREWQELSLQRMLDQNQGAISGVASKWDYDKLEWKR